MRNITISLVALLGILPAAGAAGPKINAFTNIDWTKVAGTGAPSASCVASIYGMPYTNTANGDFYVCGSTGWVLVTGGGGGGVSGSGTTGVLAIWTGSGSIGNSLADYNNTNAGKFTFTKGIIVNDGSGESGAADFLQGTLPSNTTNSVTIAGPTSVTAYRIILPGVHATGTDTFLSCTAADPSVCSWAAAGGSSVTVNGGSTLTTANLSDSTPAAGSNGKNVAFQNSGSNVSAEIVGDGTSTHFLNGIGTYTTPAGTGTVTTTGSPASGNLTKFSGATSIVNGDLSGDATTSGTLVVSLAAQYKKGSCTEVWVGSGTSSALTSGDDAFSNNTCYNDSGVTRTITAVKCRSDNASNTTTVNPTFGSAGTGTTILSGAVTCGSSLAYSSSGSLSNTAWTTGTGINPVMSGTLTGTSIAMIVEYTF